MQEKVNKFSSIKERILYYIDNQKIKKIDFFNKIQITSANFRGKAQNTPLNSTTIENIITHYPNINLYWLITGKGEMLSNNSTVTSIDNQNLKETSIELQDLIATQKELIKMQKDKIEELERKLSEGKKGKEKAS